MPYMESTDAPKPKKLILCFDGTGNTFSGSNADTNVVKILSKLDRNHPGQYHYYQTGIGTYDIGETSVNKTVLGEMRSSISQTIDQGFGTTFDAHVMAGYRFLMRYYESNAKIYIFGFSRGAFTAKFLARMVNKVGLLCKGNEEMVPFAFRLYQRYLQGDIKDRVDAQGRCNESHDHTNTNTNGNASPSDPLLSGSAKVHQSHTTEVALNEITAFSQTFCRKEKTKVCDHDGEEGEEVDQNIKVFFLGIWDCVNSVAVLERKTPVPVPVTGTANYVRHAVAVDERRVKFKPALLAQEIRVSKHNHDDEDIKEVWFPGCHGDVGGGWPSSEDNPLDNVETKMTFWQRVKNFLTSRKPAEASKNIDADRLQMSDIPLAWMIREVELVGEKEPDAAVHWCDSLQKFKSLINNEDKKKQAQDGFIHDSLAFGYGTAFFKVLMWKFMEYLPFITRWELEQTGWVNVRFPLNKGSARDIPQKAVLHASLVRRLKEDSSYCPTNNHGSDTAPCLKRSSDEVRFVEHQEKNIKNEWVKITESDPDHQTYDIVHITYSGSSDIPSQNYDLHDPPLTDLGVNQCSHLRKNLIATFSDSVINTDDVAIVVSPMRRTLQTAMLSLDWLVERGVKIEGDADWQENSDKPCDTGSAISSVAPDFPKVNLSTVDALWPDKTPPAAQRYAHTKRDILARGRRALKGLRSRPEKLIFVVSHSGFLRLGVTGYWFFNSDYRMFDFEAERGAEDDGVQVKQRETTTSGGLGLSWKDPVALGLDLPDEGPEVPEVDGEAK
ncbi:hypothetical protein FDECE_5693 [Fusarium decemcellulare]|nr:hypothetical protein FDECE_5693 [Fusarium decemcellulare]